MQKPFTPKRLENIALYYLERFDASSEKLRQMLKRRIQHHQLQNIPVDKNINQWIEDVIQKLRNLGYIDDNRYAENVIRRLSQQGKSSRFIKQKLQMDGVENTTTDFYFDAETDLENARIFVKKKHLGNCYEKDMAKLARAGFDYETAKQALNEVAPNNT